MKAGKIKVLRGRDDKKAEKIWDEFRWLCFDERFQGGGSAREDARPTCSGFYQSDQNFTWLSSLAGGIRLRQGFGGPRV